ncbi:MAG: endonuclease [Leptonema sp. (in: bacteria)]
MKLKFFIFIVILNSLYPQDVNYLIFFEKFIDTAKYSLKENYGKGCQFKTKQTQNFHEAKQFLKTLYLSHFPYTFYCNCKIILDFTTNKIVPNTKECGYQPKSKSTVWMVNWEHVVPASRFGKMLSCWTEKLCKKNNKSYKGRKCCNEIDPCFNIMEGDAHNLVPTIYELNHDRRDYSYGILEGEKREYGNCDFEVESSLKITEPKENIRGDIARIYLYMSWFYKIPLTEEEKKWIEEWNTKDPPNEEEKKLNALKAKYNGNENPFVTYYKLQSIN